MAAPSMNAGRTVIALSGGLDSFVLMLHLQKQGIPCHPVFFNYGSKHNKWEAAAVSAICKRYYLKPHVFDLTSVFAHCQSASVLMDGGGDIPNGHYSEESMRQTVVPGRNLVMLALLASYAEAIGANHVAIGAHAGDHFIYPDCRPTFLQATGEAILLSTDKIVTLLAPFKEIDKKMIVTMGCDLNAPFEITRTCYKDQDRPCGKCGSCQERLEAFSLNSLLDPLPYECRELIPKSA